MAISGNSGRQGFETLHASLRSEQAFLPCPGCRVWQPLKCFCRVRCAALITATPGDIAGRSTASGQVRLQLSLPCHSRESGNQAPLLPDAAKCPRKTTVKVVADVGRPSTSLGIIYGLPHLPCHCACLSCPVLGIHWPRACSVRLSGLTASRCYVANFIRLVAFECSMRYLMQAMQIIPSLSRLIVGQLRNGFQQRRKHLHPCLHSPIKDWTPFPGET